jgi:ribosomal protein S12 methylthiotransferase accessory factor
MTEVMERAVVGTGRLAAAINAAVNAVLPGHDRPILVSAYDTWDDDRDRRFALDARDRGIAALPVRVELSEVVIGPLTEPGTPGCHACLLARRGRARADGEQRARLVDRYATELASRTPALLTALAADTLAAIVESELRTPRRTRGGIVIVELAGLRVRTHRFLPDPECACGGLPVDTRDAAEVTLESRPKLSPTTFRIRDLVPEVDRLTGLFVDPEAGVIRDLRLVGLGTFPTLEAAVCLPGRRRPEGGYGRSFDLRAGRVTALAESLERLGGWHPQARRTTVRGTYRELAGDALDPKTLGLYPDERHDQPGFRYQRYHDDLEIPWVWGYSFRRQRPVLVPESVAYYGTTQSRHGPDRPFVHEVSNGCAVGGCLEEAIFYGLLEVAERDGFLLTWLTRMAVPRIDLSSAVDRTIPLIVERLRHAAGYEIAVFNTTMEQRIPCFWAMAIDRTGDPGRPKAICTGGSNPDPEKGVVNALHELAPMIDALPGSYVDNRDRVERMVRDPGEVGEMAHHVLLYSHPATFERFDFLFAGDERRPFRDFAERWQWPRHTDIRADAVEMIGRFLGTGLDVIVVDQTGPDHRYAGLTCVKAIVPGAVPITFGHAYRRVDGLPRLLSVPQLLGYRDRPLDPTELNPDPHPFP